MASAPVLPSGSCERMSRKVVEVRVPLISKTRYLAGLQCPKLLWYHFNQPDAFPPVDTATQALFDQGSQVGAVAKTLFPKGLEVGAGVIKKTAVDELSRAALPKRRPMFEAGFISGCAYARADVLVPVGRDEWDVVEVKSTTKAKDVHISDLALQRHVYEHAGLPVRRCFVMHLNNEYVRQGEIDARKLLTQTEVTAEVDEAVGDVDGALKKMVAVIGQKKVPAVDIGPQCSDPYDCPLTELCWKSVAMTKTAGNAWTLFCSLSSSPPLSPASDPSPGLPRWRRSRRTVARRSKQARAGKDLKLLKSRVDVASGDPGRRDRRTAVWRDRLHSRITRSCEPRETARYHDDLGGSSFGTGRACT